MRFVIHGAGAVGSLIGGMLAESGAEVILIAREAHATAINQHGLRIQSDQGERIVKTLCAVISPSEITPRNDDVLLLTVKSAQTAACVQTLREVFAGSTPIFCLQNGVRNEELAARRFLHVYGAVAALCVNFFEPGVIAHAMGRTIGLGNYPLGCDELCQQVAAQFEKAGFRTTTHEAVMAAKWSTLILNLNNATFAIIDQHLRVGQASPEISRFVADVEEEALHVLEVAGISISDPNNPIDFQTRLHELRTVVEDPKTLREAENVPFELRTYPSTWMDLWQRRGETEAGYFNGEIILLGEKYGVATPYNSTLFNVVETMAAEGVAPGRHRLDELIALVEQRRRKIYDEDE